MEELKRVSFAVAKAIKEAGYPQDDLSFWYDANGVVFAIRPKEGTEYYVAPEYLKVWLWLWREKRIAVEADYSCANDDWFDGGICGGKFSDPEEEIIAAIEYIVTNKLLK